MTNPAEQLPASPDAGNALMTVEVLPGDLVRRESRGGVSLRGEAARSLRDSLGTAVVETLKVGRGATQATYRVVAPEKAAQGIADGSLRWATASKGDASLLIKDSMTGRIAGHGQLQKVRPSPAKVLSPAAWEAMAMATQQHYLVEINEKLESVVKGVDEVLSRMDDDKRGTLKQVRRVVEASRDRLSEGHVPSAGRREELRDGVRDADRVWHQLNERVVRHLDAYRLGKSTADDVEEAWAMLLFATQVLGEAGAFLTALPYETVEALEEATCDERDRVLAAVEAVRALASELHAAHLDWSAKNAEYQFRRTRNPAKKAVRAVRKNPAIEPAVKPLDDFTAWRASQLAAPPRPPAALLITVKGDDSVEVAAEPAGAESVI